MGLEGCSLASGRRLAPSTSSGQALRDARFAGSLRREGARKPTPEVLESCDLRMGEPRDARGEDPGLSAIGAAVSAGDASTASAPGQEGRVKRHPELPPGVSEPECRERAGSGPTRAAREGSVSAQSTHSSETQQTVAKGGKYALAERQPRGTPATRPARRHRRSETSTCSDSVSASSTSIPKVTDGALCFRVSEQQLDRSKILALASRSAPPWCDCIE